MLRDAIRKAWMGCDIPHYFLLIGEDDAIYYLFKMGGFSFAQICQRVKKERWQELTKEGCVEGVRAYTYCVLHVNPSRHKIK